MLIDSDTSLGNTVMFVTATFPAESLTVNVSELAPLPNGMFSTQKLPSRSTMPNNVFVSPLLSTIYSF